MGGSGGGRKLSIKEYEIAKHSVPKAHIWFSYSYLIDTQLIETYYTVRLFLFLNFG